MLNGQEALSGSCLFVLLLLLFLVVIKLYMVYGAQAWPPESNSNSSCPKLVKHDQHHHAPAFSKRFRKIGRLMCDNYVRIIKQSSLLPSHRPCRRLSRCPSHRPGHRPSCCLSRSPCRLSSQTPLAETTLIARKVEVKQLAHQCFYSHALKFEAPKTETRRTASPIKRGAS